MSIRHNAPEESGMRLIIVWLLNALALLAVAYLMPSIHVAGFTGALIAAAVIGLVNMLIRPLLVLLTLPVTVLTLGLFIFVINGLLFFLVGHFLEGFEVRSLLSGILGAILYSLISWALTALVLGDKD
jgi:putative membrane protein